MDLGQSTLDVPPELVAGGGLVWAYRHDAGDLVLVDPTTARIARHVPIPAARPFAHNRLQYSLGATWVVQPGLLWKITTSGAAESFDLPDSFPPQAMAATAHWLWLNDGNRLLRIDPANPASSRRTVPSDVEQLLANADGLFATAANGRVIRRLDPETGEVLSSVPVGGREYAALVDGGSQLWAKSNGCNLLHITDWQSPQLVTTRVSDVSQTLPTAVAFGSLWVGDEVYSRIVRVDLESGHVLARIPFVAADPDDPAFWIVAGSASVWIVDINFADGISRVDPRTNRVVRLIPANHGTSGLSAVVAQAPGKPTA